VGYKSKLEILLSNFEV